MYVHVAEGVFQCFAAPLVSLRHCRFVFLTRLACLSSSIQPTIRANQFVLFVTLSVSVCLFTSSLPLPLYPSARRELKLRVYVILALHSTSRFIQSHSCIKASINNRCTSFNLLVSGSRAKDDPLGFRTRC